MMLSTREETFLWGESEKKNQMAWSSKGEITMTRELLNIFGMNTMMAEDVNEPSLRVHPHHKIRKDRKNKESRDINETFLRMLTAR